MGEDIGKYKIVFILMLIMIDLLICNGLFLLFSLYPCLVDMSLRSCRMLWVLVNLGYLVTAAIFPVKVDSHNMRFDRIVRNTFIRVAGTISIAVVCMSLVDIPGGILHLCIILYGVSLFILVVTGRYMTRFLMMSILRHSGSRTKAVVLGAGILGQKIYDEISRNPYLGINMLGFFDDDPARGGVKRLGSIDEVKRYCVDHGIRQIYCTLPVSAREKILEVIDFAEMNVIRFHVVPEVRRYTDMPMVLESVGTMPILSIRKVPLAYAHYAFIKRMFDIVFSLLLLITLFPVVYIVVAIAVKLSSPGPVFFRQERTGMDGYNFYCYKFRSMRVNTSADTLQATADDNRKTRVGDFLRRTSIDELPQFINVLCGDMSVVGPRPHMKYHTSQYSRIVDKYMVRHLIRPGITGLAQVTGFRGETKGKGSMEGRIMRDIWYIEHWTLALDIKIIWKTVVQMFRGDAQAY